MLSYLPKHPKVHVFQGPNWCHAGCSFSLVALIYFWSGYNLYSEQDNSLFSTSNHRLLKRNVCNKFIEHGLCARYSARNWSGYKESKALSQEVLTLVGESWVTVTRMEGCLADMASEPFLVSCQSSNLVLTLSWHQTLLHPCDFTFSGLTYSMLVFVICLWACRGSRWRRHHFLTFNRAWYMCVLKYLFKEWVNLRGGNYSSVSGAPEEVWHWNDFQLWKMKRGAQWRIRTYQGHKYWTSWGRGHSCCLLGNVNRRLNWGLDHNLKIFWRRMPVVGSRPPGYRRSKMSHRNC